MALSEDVQYISLHKPLPLLLHGYVAPFILAYASLLAVWVGVYGFWEYLEAFLILYAIVAGLDIIACLFCVWSVHVRCVLTCRKVSLQITYFYHSTLIGWGVNSLAGQTHTHTHTLAEIWLIY